MSCTFIWAQSIPGSSVNANKLNPAQLQQLQDYRQSLKSGNRVQQSIYIDYDELDETAVLDQGGVYERYAWRLHSNLPNLPVFNGEILWAVVVFDTIVDNTTGVGYSVTTTPYTLDSFDLVFNHERNPNSSTPDTLIVKVYRGQGAAGIQTSGANIANPILWSDTIITTTNLSPSGQYTVQTFYPVTNLGQGDRFVIGVEFFGDTTNQFQFSAGHGNTCGTGCGAAPSTVDFNSIYRINYNQNGQNVSGVNILYADCNGNGTSDDGQCEEWYIQNIVIVPYLTIDPPFLATPRASVTTGCPGNVVNLSANASGGSSIPDDYTYIWSGNGTFTSPNSSITSVTLPSTNGVVTYSVMVIDENAPGGADTITANVNVTVRGITVTLGNDTTIGCGDSISVTAVTGGFVNGSTFAWSNGANTSSTFVKNGTHSVTVTNNAGCSATDSKIVSLDVNQTVRFTAASSYYNPTANDTALLTQNRVCPDKTITFTNTSTNTTDWTFTWDYGNGFQSGNINGTGSYPAGGTTTYTVTLTADNGAGCQVSSAPFTISVVPANFPRCVLPDGVAEVELLSNIALYPNPNTGSFTLDLSKVNAENANVMVVDLMGKVVYNTNTFSTIAAPVQNIDLNVANGIYFVRVTANGVTATSKISVAK